MLADDFEWSHGWSAPAAQPCDFCWTPVMRPARVQASRSARRSPTSLDQPRRRIGAIIQSTDPITTLPRHIGETLAQASDLAVHACPIPVEGFAVRQHWHARYHHEAGNRWLRGLVIQLFGASR